MKTDYQRIAHAIDYLRDNAGSQPSLAEVARQVNLSQYHFQRLFARWAGVSPKRYLQFLTLEHAKAVLLGRELSTLDVSEQLGLSSSSRLYDHFVKLEAVTPSEFRTRGKDLRIRYGLHDSCYGPVFVALTDRGICQISFSGEDSEALARLRTDWPNAELVSDPGGTAAVTDRIFATPKSGSLPLSLWVPGTNFQLSVWRALLKLQPGEVCSYARIASDIGKPGAVRAVGRAVGANPVALLIPCHRVLRKNGELGGYRWGETRKQAILARESAVAESRCRSGSAANQSNPRLK